MSGIFPSSGPFGSSFFPRMFPQDYLQARFPIRRAYDVTEPLFFRDALSFSPLVVILSCAKLDESFTDHSLLF